jgi:hypothetical protein
MLGTTGVSLLVGGLFEAIAGEDVLAESDTELALGLSLTIVGVTAWVIFWLAAQRSVARHPVESRSVLRRFYLTLVRGVAVVFVLVSAIPIGAWALGAEDFQGGAWGNAIAWGALWLFHSRIAAEPAPTDETRLIDRYYQYFAALAGLVALAIGGGVAIAEPLQSAYDALFLDELVDGGADWSENGRAATAAAVAGAAVWFWHWRRLVTDDAGTTLSLVYLFLFGVLGGLATVLITSTGVLFFVLQWAIGTPEEETAAAHFSDLPGFIAALLVGAAVWGYHRAVLAEGARRLLEGWSEPERAYRYLVAAGGLATLAGALVALFALGIDGLTVEDELVRADDWWRDQLVWGLTLLIVGASVWARYWFVAQRQLAIGGIEEQSATSRRIFLFAVFGIAGLTTLINLTITLFRVTEDLLEGELALATVRDVRWSVALILTAGALAIYHWLVLREDQQALDLAAPAEAPVGPRDIVLLTGGEDDALARELEQRFGSRVRVWRRLDHAGRDVAISADQIEAMAAELGAHADERVAVVIGDAGRFEVVPYTLDDS